MERNLLTGLTLYEWLKEYFFDALYVVCRKTGIFWIERKIEWCHDLKWIISDMAWQEELKKDMEA